MQYHPQWYSFRHIVPDFKVIHPKYFKQELIFLHPQWIIGWIDYGHSEIFDYGFSHVFFFYFSSLLGEKTFEIDLKIQG